MARSSSGNTPRKDPSPALKGNPSNNPSSPALKSDAKTDYVGGGNTTIISDPNTGNFGVYENGQRIGGGQQNSLIRQTPNTPEQSIQSSAPSTAQVYTPPGDAIRQAQQKGPVSYIDPVKQNIQEKREAYVASVYVEPLKRTYNRQTLDNIKADYKAGRKSKTRYFFDTLGGEFIEGTTETAKAAYKAGKYVLKNPTTGSAVLLYGMQKGKEGIVSGTKTTASFIVQEGKKVLKNPITYYGEAGNKAVQGVKVAGTAAAGYATYKAAKFMEDPIGNSARATSTTAQFVLGGEVINAGIKGSKTAVKFSGTIASDLSKGTESAFLRSTKASFRPSNSPRTPKKGNTNKGFNPTQQSKISRRQAYNPRASYDKQAGMYVFRENNKELYRVPRTGESITREVSQRGQPYKVVSTRDLKTGQSTIEIKNKLLSNINIQKKNIPRGNTLPLSSGGKTQVSIIQQQIGSTKQIQVRAYDVKRQPLKTMSETSQQYKARQQLQTIQEQKRPISQQEMEKRVEIISEQPKMSGFRPGMRERLLERLRNKKAEMDASRAQDKPFYPLIRTSQNQNNIIKKQFKDTSLTSIEETTKDAASVSSSPFSSIGPARKRRKKRMGMDYVREGVIVEDIPSAPFKRLERGAIDTTATTPIIEPTVMLEVGGTRAINTPSPQIIDTTRVYKLGGVYQTPKTYINTKIKSGTKIISDDLKKGSEMSLNGIIFTARDKEDIIIKDSMKMDYKPLYERETKREEFQSTENRTDIFQDLRLNNKQDLKREVREKQDPIISPIFKPRGGQPIKPSEEKFEFTPETPKPKPPIEPPPWKPIEKPKPPIEPPPEKPPRLFERPKKERSTLYDVLVRRAGKFKKQKSGLEYDQAFKFGSMRVRDTAAASFKIVEQGSTKAVTKPNLFSRMFKPSKTERGVYVQKNKFRISSSGEKKEITFAGLREQKRRRSIWGF